MEFELHSPPEDTTKKDEDQELSSQAVPQTHTYGSNLHEETETFKFDSSGLETTGHEVEFDGIIGSQIEGFTACETSNQGDLDSTIEAGSHTKIGFSEESRDMDIVNPIEDSKLEQKDSRGNQLAMDIDVVRNQEKNVPEHVDSTDILRTDRAGLENGEDPYQSITFQHEESGEKSSEQIWEGEIYGSGTVKDQEQVINHPSDDLDQKEEAHIWNLEGQTGRETDSLETKPQDLYADFFEHLSGPSTSGVDKFAAGDPDTNNRPHPESQGYALLPDTDELYHAEFDSEEGNTSPLVEEVQMGSAPNNYDSIFPRTQEEANISDNQVDAVSQVQESPFKGDTALKFVAHEPNNSSAPQPEKAELHDVFQERQEEGQSQSFEDLWMGVPGSDDDFNLGNMEGQGTTGNIFSSNNGFPDHVFSDHAEVASNDPFAQIVQTSQNGSSFNITDTAEKEESEELDLLDEKNFDELFPKSENQFTLEQAVPAFPSSVPPPVSTLFGEASNDPDPFGVPADFPTVTVNPDVPEHAPSQNGGQELQTSEVPSLEEVTGDDPTDDLDFIDDTEFMAAFGAQATVTIPPPKPAAPVEPQSPRNDTTQPQPNRYAPHQPTIRPSQSLPSIQPKKATAAITRPPVATPSRYALPMKYIPSSQPSPSAQPAQQLAPTAVLNQQPLRPPPKQEVPTKGPGSFVTAKGAYSSPYDLPPQIAQIPKRHVTQPPPPRQSPTVTDAHHPSAGPPPRATSAQPQFQPPPPNARASTQYVPPKAMSPPLRRPSIPQPSQYASNRMVSPPTQRTIPTQHQGAYPTEAGYPSSISTSPPIRHVQTGTMYTDEKVTKPPTQPSPPVTYFRASSVQTRPHPVSSPPVPAVPPRYAPPPRTIPQRSVSAQPHMQTSQPPRQLTATSSHGSPHTQPRVSSTPPQQYDDSHQQGYVPEFQIPSHARPLNQPQSIEHPYPGASGQFRPENLRSFPTGQDQFFYPPPQTVSQPEDPNADLPPHFSMETGEYEHVYDSAELQGASMQVPDRNILKTPEQVAPTQPNLDDEVSPPRPWERATSLGTPQSPPKPRSYSPYEPHGSAPSTPLSIQTLDRHRSASPQPIRPPQPSPRKDIMTERSMSYPSRKPPSHLKFQATFEPTVPRTLEEDLQYRRAGYPVVNFGFGGRLITMIPRTAHRVVLRGAAPLSVPGTVIFTNIKDILELPGLVSSFPGPLYLSTKAVKSKSKEIGKWLDDNLALIELSRDSANLDEDDIQRIEDRKILYKLVKLLVDNNGVLEGNPEVEKSVKELLLPQTSNMIAMDESDSFGVTASSLANPSNRHPIKADPNALATYNLTTDFLRSMRNLLQQGERQGAIRKAVDQKMWGHALLIASSVNQAVWRETVEQFIRSELRESGAKDFDSLRFLYGILGGEAIDAVNELLPPLNRMISSIHPTSPIQTARLGSWKESIGMTLLNQGSLDITAPIIGLGQALVNEGRIEAGHSCFLLTKATKGSPPGAPDALFTILGGNNHVGLSQVMLSEILEYSQSSLVPAGYLHLLPYKLYHAWFLADYGHTDLAAKYCESIGATLQKEKRSSVFITATMIAVLKDLTERISECSQPGSTEKSSWLGKKSALGENFWKALEINLTKFVAGDETTEDSSQRGTPKRQVEAQDPRFNRIASDTSLNRMTSLPNLRAQTTTPVYAGMQSDTIRHSGASRYGTVVSERYAPSPRYEQVQEVNESELGISPVAEEPSEPIHGRYSPYLPQAPPAPPAPSEGLSQPRPESAPREAEKPVAEESRKEESEVSPKQQDKKVVEKASSGWFTGWFKRTAAEPAPGTPGKPVKAKLGEESSFYYDKELKKWVNKKAGDAPAKAAPPPPPPKRTINPAPTPTQQVPSVPAPAATATPPAPSQNAIAHTPAKPPTPRTAGPTLLPAGLPPSRPSSVRPPPSQKEDSLEALLASRPASGAKGPKKSRSRYVDVMNKK